MIGSRVNVYNGYTKEHSLACIANYGSAPAAVS